MRTRLLALTCAFMTTANAASLVPVKRYTDVVGPIRAVSFTPDGESAVVSSGTLAYIVNTRTLQAGRAFNLFNFNNMFQWTGPSSFNMYHQGEITEFSIALGEKIQKKRVPSAYGKLAYSNNGLIAAEVKNEIQVFEQGSFTRKISIPIPVPYVNSLDISQDGTRLTIQDYKTAYLYDVNSGALIRRLATSGTSVSQVAFGGDLLAVAGGYPSRLQVFSSLDGEPQFELPGPATGVFEDMAFSPDGKKLAVPTLESFYVYDVPQRTLALKLDHPSSSPSPFAFSPDSTSVLVGNTFGQLRMADLTTNRVVKESAGYSGDQVGCLGLSPNGKSVLLCGYNFHAKIVDTVSGQLQTMIGPHKSTVHSGLFLSDGQVVTTSDDEIYLWKAGRLVRRTKAAGNGLSTVMAAQPNGTLFAYASLGSDNGVVVIEDAKTGKQVAKTTVPSYMAANMAFTKDGTRLAIQVSAGKLILWDWAKGKIAASAIVDEYNDALARSPSGKYFAVKIPSGVGILDANTLKLVRAIPFEYVDSLTFAAQQDHVIVRSLDGVQVFNMAGKRISEFELAIGSGGRVFVTPDGLSLVMEGGDWDMPVVATRYSASSGGPAFR